VKRLAPVAVALTLIACNPPPADPVAVSGDLERLAPATVRIAAVDGPQVFATCDCGATSGSSELGLPDPESKSQEA